MIWLNDNLLYVLINIYKYVTHEFCFIGGGNEKGLFAL